MRRNTRTHCLYAEALKGLVELSNPQEVEDRTYDQPTEQTQKRCAISVVTEDFLTLVDDQEISKTTEGVQNTKQATAEEMKKAAENNNKKIEAIESSVQGLKTSFKLDMEEMKPELTKP
eukprot:9175563-Ditylum_brightwellii.AAC.1